jgi:uncharacterized membrane protein (UPF0127 family)
LKAKPSVKVIHRDTGEILIESARWCESYFCRLVGLQFRRRLKPGAALILVNKKESRNNSSIHMFFVFFPIAAVWINSQGQVTSVQLARPWRPYYASPTPAQYVLESTTDLLERIKVGDAVDFLRT